MKYLIFKGENIVFSTDDKQKALDEFSKIESPKDDRPSTRVELYERIAKKNKELCQKKIVKCDSGEMGVQQKLRTIYDDYQDFLVFDKIFNIAKRLGYDNPKKLWDDNPLVQGSSNPSDFKIAKNGSSRT